MTNVKNKKKTLYKEFACTHVIFGKIEAAKIHHKGSRKKIRYSGTSSKVVYRIYDIVIEHLAHFGGTGCSSLREGSTTLVYYFQITHEDSDDGQHHQNDVPHFDKFKL